MKRQYAAPPRRNFKRQRKGAVITNNRYKKQQAYLGIEKKFVDRELAETSLTSAWAMYDPATTSLSPVVQGDGESARDGRQYTIRDITIHAHLRQGAQEAIVDPPNDTIARVALIWDKQTNGAAPTPANIFTTGGAQAFSGFRNLEYVERFEVLADKMIELKQQTLSHVLVNSFSSTGVSTHFKMRKVFKNGLKVTCSDTAATIAAIVDNSLHVIATVQAISPIFLS